MHESNVKVRVSVFSTENKKQRSEVTKPILFCQFFKNIEAAYLPNDLKSNWKKEITTGAILNNTIVVAVFSFEYAALRNEQ